MVQTVYCSHQCEFGQTLGKHDDCLHQISVPEKHGSKLILEGYKNCYSSHVQNLFKRFSKSLRKYKFAFPDA